MGIKNSKKITVGYKSIEQVDTSTGEVFESKYPITIRYSESVHFVKIYEHSTMSLVGLQGKELNLLIYLSSISEHNKNTVAITIDVKNRAGLILGVSSPTISNMLSSLTKKRFLFRVMRGLFVINPKFIFKGDEKSREKLIKEIYTLNSNDE